MLYSLRLGCRGEKWSTVHLVFAYFLPEAGAKGWRRSVPKVGRQKQTSFTRYALPKNLQIALVLCSIVLVCNGN
jgi:hypothetical protein